MEELNSNNTESQENMNAYESLLSDIEQRNDPKSNTVLIVDDERSIRRSVARQIRKKEPNAIIFEASDGQEGLNKLAEIREKYEKDPLFIILDLNMPVMDGWETIDALKEDYESKGLRFGIPIIVLSSTSGEKGVAFFKQSIHGRKNNYQPLVGVAKEDGVNAGKYDTSGEQGLSAWAQYFVKKNIV